MAYAFMSIQKIKNATQFFRKEAHNLREGFVANADITRNYLNEELVKPSDNNCRTFYDFYQKRVAESEFYKTHKVRSDAVKGLEIMMTYGKNKDETMPDKFSFEEWKKKNVEWLEETFGKENIASVVLHMDEVTPHIHAIVVPMVDEKLNATHYMKHRSDLSRMQTSYADKMKDVGLERGLKHSKAKHQDIQKFYTELNNVLEHVLPEVEKGESVEEYRERANEHLQKVNIKHFQEIKKMEREIVETQTISLNEKLDFLQEKQDLKKERAEFEKERNLFEEEYFGMPKEAREEFDLFRKQQEAFEEYEDREFADAVLAGLQEIERAKKERDEKKRTEELRKYFKEQGYYEEK